MGAVLGYKPPKGSLIEKRNKKNYKFSKTDELKIIGWINENLMVNWVESAGDLDSLETSLIVKYLPLLNLSKIQLRFKFCRICEKNVSKSRIEIRNWRYNLIALGNIPMLRVYSYLCFYGQRGDHHYRTADGETRLEVRMESDSVWLTQAQMAELFQTTPQNITMHTNHVFREGELERRQLVRDPYKFAKRVRARFAVYRISTTLT